MNPQDDAAAALLMQVLRIPTSIAEALVGAGITSVEESPTSHTMNGFKSKVWSAGSCSTYVNALANFYWRFRLISEVWRRSSERQLLHGLHALESCSA